MAAAEEIKSANTRFLESAKDFSFDQKLSVVQSILTSIPSEQQKPWNVSQAAWDRLNFQKINKTNTQQLHLAASASAGDSETVDLHSQTESSQALNQYGTLGIADLTTTTVDKAPPIIDPYEQSMKYYEKHVVLNHFQVSTGKHLE